MRNAQTDLAKFVPEGWKVAPLRWYLSCKSGESIDSNLVEKKATNQNNIPVIGGNGVMGYSNRSNVNFETISIGRVGALCGNTHYINESVWITDNSLLISHYNRKEINLEFLKFVLEQLNLNQYSTSTAQPLITGETIKKRIIAFPSLNVQVKIVNYIYQKTSEIDVLINKKQNLINLFNQQRQSIITEAVTKGLNPNVTMKDSGVEWIGEIPEHWELTKIKYVAKLLNGDRGENYPSGNDFVDEGIPFITSHDLNGRYVNESNLKYISEERYNLLRGIKVKENDIIYCLRGSVGKNALVTKDKGTIASSLMGIRASTKVNAEFLSYILNSKMEVWNRSMLTTGSVSDNLSAENVGTYLFTFPDLNEQCEIVNYLNTEMLKLEELIIVVNQQIEKLKEYRQSLIYEAVTGKIDVRELELD